jgi:hypothetical protein
MVLWKVPETTTNGDTTEQIPMDPTELVATVEPAYINISDSTAQWTGIYERCKLV